jgi:hypothetical protein
MAPVLLNSRKCKFNYSDRESQCSPGLEAVGVGWEKKGDKEENFCGQWLCFLDYGDGTIHASISGLYTFLYDSMLKWFFLPFITPNIKIWARYEMKE